MTNPNTPPELNILNPADLWGQKPVHQSMKESTVSDPTGNYAGARWVDGQLVTDNRNKTLHTSHAATVSEADAAQAVPYTAAYDPIYRSRVSPDQVKDDTILRFPNGAEVTARDAKKMGWLANASRPFAEGQPQPQQQPTPGLQIQQQQPQQELHPDLQTEAFSDPAVERTLTNLVTNTGGLEQYTAIQEIVTTGDIGERTLSTLATQLAKEPSALKAEFAPVLAAYEAQGRAAFAEGGLNPDDVIAWAQTNKGDALNRAMHRHATQRSTKGYSELSREYLCNLAEHRPSDALNADLGNGITQYQDTKGRVMVRIPGLGDMEWRTAIQAFGPRN